MLATADDELNGDGDCSLREAIQAANLNTAVDACAAGSGADIIELPAGTYTLSIAGEGEDGNATGDLDISGNLTINGAGEATTIIDGAHLDRVFHVHGGTVEMSGLTVLNGSSGGRGGRGGGIYIVNGRVTLNNSTVRDNWASVQAGGIYNGNTLTLINSTVSGNSADGPASSGGGGIWNAGTLKLTNSTVSGNSVGDPFGELAGAGITSTGGTTLELTNSTVRNNWGDGIASYYSTVTLNSSTVRNNTITGIANWYGGVTAILNSSTVSGNGGGGIWNDGTVILNGSTVSGNRNGAAIVNSRGTVTLTNSTASGNPSGGILNEYGTVTLNSSTVSGNWGGGIFTLGGAVTLENTIVAKNAAGDCVNVVSRGGTITSYGYNLDSDGTCLVIPTAGDLPGTDPLLGPLADNGGPTFTQALLAGSPAIDAIPLAHCNNADGNPLTTDQRGVARPQGAACDIGAYEFEPAVGTLSVGIDIKPGSSTNPINPNSKGKTPVAILSTSDFDATTELEKDSLTFGRTGDEDSLAKCGNSGEDVNGDGLLDIVGHFTTRDTAASRPAIPRAS